MMKNKLPKYIMLLPLLAIISTGCKKFDEINTNPNQTTEVSSGVLATTLILSITRNEISGTKGFMQSFLYGKYLTWGEGQENSQYNKIGRTNFDRITLLRNIKPMVDYATTEELRNAYSALGHFVRAWQFFLTTMQVGDIPYSEAVKGESDAIIKPKYDDQKTVFQGILNELDSANLLFSKAVAFKGDPIYDGDVDKWQRLTNTFQLYVLMNLYKKTSDAELSVTDRFKDIVANRPLMRNYNDNFALEYNSKAGQHYPWSNIPDGDNPNIKSNYAMVSATIINPLKALEDRRLFYYAKPSPVQIADGKLPSDYAAYIGAEPSNQFPVLQTMRVGRDYSDFNNRYILEVSAEPVGLLNYWDLQFVLAEATVRGWITGTPAQTYYAAGITSSMNFIMNYTKDIPDYTHDMPMDETYINAYPATAAVALSGSEEQQIEKIITQKYIAGFLHGFNYMAWYENRRTGYPEFILNPTSNLNTPNTQFPVRWLYPSNELSYNTDNLDTAIKRQYDGNDNVNSVMWLLK